MLQLRPNCENCNKNLPPESTEACICSYECTFCRGCVDDVLENVCPNCGGGFVPRPLRPKSEWRAGVSRLKQLPATASVLKPVDVAEHGAFSAALKNMPPAER